MNLRKHLFAFSLFYCLIIESVDSKCQESFQCGKFSLGFPFSNVKDPGCGFVKVDGCDSRHPISLSPAGGYGYPIRQNISANKSLILDPNLQIPLHSGSCYSFTNVSLPTSPSISFTFSPNLTFFTCFNRTPTEAIEEYFRDYEHQDCAISVVYYKTQGAPALGESSFPRECSATQLPVNSSQNSTDLFNLLTPEFVLEWSVSKACQECYRRGGQCLSDNQNKFYCRTENGAFRKIFLTGGLTMDALTSTFIRLSLFIWRKYTMLRLLGLQRAKSANEKDIELILKNNGNLAPRRYRYAEVKKMTKSFDENLGKGGYGSVYKGKLPDGCPVAVKLLNESKGNGEEFTNEVASISRTSHINIVSLLGFCFDGSKRALIYDFMPNRSLEKSIENTGFSSVEGRLG